MADSASLRRSQYGALSAAIAEISSRLSPRLRTYLQNAALGMEAGVDTGPLGPAPPSLTSPRSPGPATSSLRDAGQTSRQTTRSPQTRHGAPSPSARTPSVNNKDVSKPIYIGGGGEGYNILGLDLTSTVEPYSEKRSGNFYTHRDDEKVRDQILRTHNAGQPVILVGHSWGGSDAIAAARWAKGRNIPIELLITADPVGVPGVTRQALRSSEPIARNWTTVTADKPGVRPGDFVANAWGKTPRFIQNEANSIIRDPGSEHADFPRMMKAADANRQILDAYKRGKAQ